MLWPIPFKAPNLNKLWSPKKINLPNFAYKPQAKLQQGDWSNVTNEPVAPFGLSQIVQGWKPIINTPISTGMTNNTPQNMPKPAQLPATGVKPDMKSTIEQFKIDMWKADEKQIRSAYPEFAKLDSKWLSQLSADLSKWATYDQIIKAYPELWINQKTQSFKTATQTQPWWWMLDYQVFWKLDPNSVENASVWWFAGNVWKSAVNMVSDIGNMITNPIQTVKWLWWMVTGAWVNAAKFLWKEFLGKTEEEMNTKLQSKIDKWGVIWMLANTVKWAENIADSAWEWAVVNRYGSLDAAKRTAYEDPVGFISDIATLVSWVGWAVKWWATAATKIPMIAKSAWTASKLWKVADIAWDIAKVADYADPANLITKGYMKAWEKIFQWAKAIPKIPWKIWWAIESWIESTATKLTKTATPQDKLFKAQEPRLNQLNKQVDYKKLRENSDIANDEIVKAWYKPVDTETRAAAHKATMDKIRKEEIESKIWDQYNIDLKPVADKIDEFVANAERAGIVTNQWQLNQLKAQAQKYREMWIINWSDWEFAKQMLNAQINNFWDASIWDVYKNWLKEATKTLWKQLDDAFSAIPWEFAEAKRRFWALKSTYEDVFKSDIKAQKAKWGSLEQSYSRIEWAGDIVRWLTSTLAWQNPIPLIAQWWAKLLVWKVLQKIKDKDFLIRKWFDDLSKNTPQQSKLNITKLSNRQALPFIEAKPQAPTPVTPDGVVQAKTVNLPQKMVKQPTIVAEKGTAVSPAEQAKFAEQKAKQQEITAKKQQVEQAKQQAESFEKKASDYQKVLEDSKDHKKLWVFDTLWGWWVRDWDYITKYWTITDTQYWMYNTLEYKIWDKWYKARDVDVFEKGATPEIIPVKESDDIVKARQDIKDMQADKQRRNLYVNQLLEEMNLKSIDDLPADKLPEFAKILRTRNRSWEWMTRYENFVKENKVNKWSAIADKKVKIPTSITKKKVVNSTPYWYSPKWTTLAPSAINPDAAYEIASSWVWADIINDISLKEVKELYNKSIKTSDISERIDAVREIKWATAYANAKYLENPNLSNSENYLNWLEIYNKKLNAPNMKLKA